MGNRVARAHLCLFAMLLASIIPNPILAEDASGHRQTEPPTSFEKEAEIEPPAADPGSVAWEKVFESDVEWYKLLSVGYLLVSSGEYLYCFDPLSGNEMWKMPVNVDFDDVFEILSTHIVVLRNAKKPKQKKISANDAAQLAGLPKGGFSVAIGIISGSILWSNPKSLSGTLTVAIPFYSTGEILVMIEGATGDYPTKRIFKASKKKKQQPHAQLFMVDFNTGEQKWVRYVFDSRNAVQTIVGDLLVQNEYNEVLGISLDDGEALWYLKSKKKEVAVSGEVLVFAEDRIEAHDLSHTDKKTLKNNKAWESEVPSELGEITRIVESAGMLFMSGSSGFGAFEAQSGRQIWTLKADDESIPATVIISPNKKHAVATLYRVGGDGMRALIVDPGSGEILATLPKTDANDLEAQFFNIDKNLIVRWIDDSRILVQTANQVLAYEITDHGARVLWEDDRSTPPEYPEDIDERKKARWTSVLLMVGGLVMMVGATEFSSNPDVQQNIALVGNAAYSAGLITLAKSGMKTYADDEMIPLDKPEARKAYSRYIKRRGLIDQFKKIDVVDSGESYAVQIRDLLSGEITDSFKISTPGRTLVDNPFSLVYQRNYNDKKVLQALALPGYTTQLIEDFGDPG